MNFKGGHSRLENLAPTYLEVWEQDETKPHLYHYESETLTHDQLKDRAASMPGLTVVRIERE